MTVLINEAENSRQFVCFAGRLLYFNESLLCRAFAEKLGDIEIYEVGVMEDDRFDRALHLVAFMTMRGDNVHDFAGNPVLVGERDAAEGMPHLLPKLAVDHVT